MVKQLDYSVIIIGGGMVGLTLAVALSEANIHTAVIETTIPSLEENCSDRVSALNLVSLQILKNLALWYQCSSRAGSNILKKLHVWDNIGATGIDFNGENISAGKLGEIVENNELLRVLWQHVEKKSNVDLICPAKIEQLRIEQEYVEIWIDHKKTKTSLIIGADGAHSWLRAQLAIPITQRSCQQSALISVIKTESPHQNAARQVFSTKGIVALLPLSHEYRSALVWSTDPQYANELLEKPERDFNYSLKNTFGFRLGELKRLTFPRIFPLMTRHAKYYVKKRIALVGDAAHTIHPLAGQGVNLGLMDAACLAQCLKDAQEENGDLGALRALRRYERWRKGDNAIMILAMQTLQGLFSSTSPLLIQGRRIGLKYTNRSRRLKNYFMEIATGFRGELPELAVITSR